MSYAEVFTEWFTTKASARGATGCAVPDDALYLVEPVLSCVSAALYPKDGIAGPALVSSSITAQDMALFDGKGLSMIQRLEKTAVPPVWKARFYATVSLLLQHVRDRAGKEPPVDEAETGRQAASVGAQSGRS